jgi:uncharacterized protein
MPAEPVSLDATLVPNEPTPPVQPSPLRKIFIGKDGLRAGWSLLIFILIVAAIVISIRFVGRRLHLITGAQLKQGQEIAPLFGIANELIPFLVIFFVTWVMSKIERRPNSAYGFGDKRKFSHFFAGLAWGVALLSLLVFALRITGLLVFDSRLLFGADILRYGAIWLVGFLMVGFLEEYLTRGYVQFTLTRGLAGIYRTIFKTRRSQTLGFWTSALIFSFLFGLGHSSNPGESPIGELAAGLAGLVFCFSLWQTGSLWWAIGFHTSWDWAQSFLYGVADSGIMVQYHLFATHPVGKPIFSGGATGPEGSIFILVILPLASLVILLTLPRTPARDLHEPIAAATA